MWIKTKNGSYANFDSISYVYLDSYNQWCICEKGDGFNQIIDDETAKRLIEHISKNLF